MAIDALSGGRTEISSHSGERDAGQGPWIFIVVFSETERKHVENDFRSNVFGRQVPAGLGVLAGGSGRHDSGDG
jgi:hypothetical protein